MNKLISLLTAIILLASPGFAGWKLTKTTLTPGFSIDVEPAGRISVSASSILHIWGYARAGYFAETYVNARRTKGSRREDWAWEPTPEHPEGYVNLEVEVAIWGQYTIRGTPVSISLEAIISQESNVLPDKARAKVFVHTREDDKAAGKAVVGFDPKTPGLPKVSAELYLVTDGAKGTQLIPKTEDGKSGAKCAVKHFTETKTEGRAALWADNGVFPGRIETDVTGRLEQHDRNFSFCPR